MPEADLASDLTLLRDVAREAGRIAFGYFRKDPEVWMKGGTSPVSEADYAVDRYLQQALLSSRPHYGWLSEETVDDFARLSVTRTFIVDPIDGTRGFLEGRTEWCVSIAVVEAGRPLAGVLECPARHETLHATAGGGAFKNGQPIRVREPGPELEIGGPKNFVDLVPAEIRSRVARFRYIPSLAYRIAMIADAALDASFVKANAHDWDLAAADLILHEAGGELLNEFGATPTYGASTISHGALVAGSGTLLASIAGVIATANG